PGFGQGSSHRFCVANVCVECRASMSDCPESLPVCDASSCRACVKDDECPSEVCDVDSGVCVDPATIRYAAPNGAFAACSLSTPCSLDTALANADPQHPWVRALAGMYSSAHSSGNTFTLIATGATFAGGIDILPNGFMSMRGGALA